MIPDPQTATQAIRNAHNALQAGDKRSARRWAELAAARNPRMEEAWLILAAVASPRASLVYLEKVLEINPQSERARLGMEWARRRLGQATEKGIKPTPSPATRHPSPVPSHSSLVIRHPPPESLARRSSPLSPLLLALVIFAVAWLLWPGTASPAQALIRSKDRVAPWQGRAAPWQGRALTPTGQYAWQGVEVAKPTYTPTPTATPSPTPTPTETPTPMPLPELLPGEAIQPDALASSSGKLILVDISEQHLYAYEGGVLVFSFIASTGIGNSTRVGTFSVLEKIPNAYGSTWNIWMPNWLGIYWSGNLQNGIHALPILPGGSRLWSGYLGWPISYGCVVLGVEEAQLLYDWADIGTPVVIQW